MSKPTLRWLKREALAAQMAKIAARKAKLQEYGKEYNEKKKLRLQELQAEAEECAATGVEMAPGRAEELATLLAKKEKARQATKKWKKENVEQEKAVHQLYYQIHKPEILEHKKRQREEENLVICALAGSLAGAAGAAGGGAYTFGVLPGCRLECYPGACKACFNSKDRHTVWVRIRSAYEIETQEEVPLPVDARAEAEFVAGLGRFWCRHDCGDYLKTRVKCRFHGKCQRCSAVNRREKDRAAAHTLFYEEQRTEVQESRDLAQAQWQCWLESWKNGVAGARWRGGFKQDLVALTLRRR
jgi:TPP-dependent trihydroxycyclohexane-1,2-dione (THcHDO) dehydratase